MSRRRPRRVLDHSLGEHPAVLAWRAVSPEGAVPERIEVFCDAANWLLYALLGAGPAGSTVFAKRRLISLAATERTVYERILPLVPLATPRCYGCKEEGDFIWFLLEAVDGLPYDESNPEHLAMAGRWVATLHTSTASLVSSTPLPEAGPERYLTHIVKGRERLLRRLEDSRVLDTDGRSTVENAIAQFDDIEACWPSVRALCQDAPTTLVHGDFRPKNVFVHRDGTELVAFDWETAGWGPPAADLTKIDVLSYARTVRESWGAVSVETIREWSAVGHLFQTIAAIDWKSTELAVETPEELAIPMASLRLLSARVADVAAFLSRPTWH